MEKEELLENLNKIHDYIVERRIYQARIILTELTDEIEDEIEKKDKNGK